MVKYLMATGFGAVVGSLALGLIPNDIPTYAGYLMGIIAGSVATIAANEKKNTHAED